MTPSAFRESSDKPNQNSKLLAQKLFEGIKDAPDKEEKLTTFFETLNNEYQKSQEEKIKLYNVIKVIELKHEEQNIIYDNEIDKLKTQLQEKVIEL